MEQTPKTSFIPKQSAGISSVQPRQRRSFNVLAFISTIVFLATLALSVGVFFYKNYSKEQLQNRKAELNNLRQSIPQSDIEAIRELERRFGAVEALLDQHLALSYVFDALEARVQQNAQVTSFDFERLGSGLGQVTLGGLSESFNTVVLQERGFNEERIFEEGTVAFSDLNIDSDERVIFKVTSFLNNAAVLFRGADDVLLTETPEADTETITEEAEPVAPPAETSPTP